MKISLTVHTFGLPLNCIQVILGDTTQWLLPVTYHLLIAEPNRFAAVTPTIANRQVVTARKILERFINGSLYVIKNVYKRV
jgi:hypothetical protein